MTQGINLENIVDSYCQTPVGYGSHTLKYNYDIIVDDHGGETNYQLWDENSALLSNNEIVKKIEKVTEDKHQITTVEGNIFYLSSDELLYGLNEGDVAS